MPRELQAPLIITTPLARHSPDALTGVLITVVVLLFIASSIHATALDEPPSVELNEFVAAARQGVLDEDGDTPDWIELWNSSDAAVDLQGWFLSKSSKPERGWAFPSTNLPSKAHLLVFASGKDRRVSGRPLHTDFKLSDVGGSLELRSPDGRVSRVAEYPRQVAGVSFGRCTLDSPRGEDETPAPCPVHWTYLSQPTPGGPNASAACEGPLITALSIESADPPAVDDPIFITATIARRSSEPVELRLRYRIMFEPELEVAMVDDGAHHDGSAGDGKYGTILPARLGKPGQMLRYYLLAKESSGKASRWPLFEHREGFSACQGTVFADPSIRSRLPVLHLFSREDEEETRDLPARITLFAAGEFYDNVIVTRHGQFSRSFPKQSYNLDLPDDHRFRAFTNEGVRLKGFKLMSNFADKSKIRNTLAYEVIQSCGSLGHAAFPVRVQMNGRFHSLAEFIEDGDERWLERVGCDPQGALYKMYGNLGSARGGEKKTREHENSSDLAALVRGISPARSPAERAAYAYSNIDLPQCINYLVAMTIIGSDDHGHKNFYLYRDTRNTGEWALLPWDVDLSWGRNWTGQYFDETIYTENPLNLYRDGRSKARNPLYDLLMQYPDFRQMYLRRLRTVMDEVLQPPGTPQASLRIEARIRAWLDQIAPADTRRNDADLDASWPTWGKRRSAREEAQRIMREYLPGRREFLFRSPEARLHGDPIPPSQLGPFRVEISEIATTSADSEPFVRIQNRQETAVDLSGWQLSGAGIKHTFRSGTVLPVGRSILVVRDVPAFRKSRGVTADGSTPQFVQGNWKGELQTDAGPLVLADAHGQKVAGKSGD